MTPVKVKICGIKEVELARQAVAAGADLIGLVRVKNSKRYIDLEQAKVIAQAVKQAGGESVLVYTDGDATLMAQEATELDISIVQLHSATARTQAECLPQQVSRIYVLPVNAAGQIDATARQGVAGLDANRDVLLLDSETPGSGACYPLTAELFTLGLPTFVAGGLTVKNVATLVQQFPVAGVDVSSGVETAPGVKDIQLIREFIRQVKEVKHDKRHGRS